MMEERKENDFKMDTEDLRLLNAFGEALGDFTFGRRNPRGMECFYLPARRSKTQTHHQMWTSGIAAAIVVLVVLIVPRITNEDTHLYRLEPPLSAASFFNYTCDTLVQSWVTAD